MPALPVPEVFSPHPLGEQLPPLYEADVLMQFVARVVDRMLAPAQTTLDSIEAYVDPHLAPAEFVDWLATWVSAPLVPSMTQRRRRDVVAVAGRVQAVSGLATAVVDLLTAALDVVDVDVVEGGGTWWSTTPRSIVPDEDGRPDVLVRVTPVPGAVIDEQYVARLVDSVLPAHVPFRVEVRRSATVPRV